MFENPIIPSAEKAPSLISQLQTYISSLPRSPGESYSQGQVQIREDGAEMYLDSALYNPVFTEDTFTFKVADADGVLRSYQCTENNGTIVCTDIDSKEVEVEFVGFRLTPVALGIDS